jgi:hypothetical protein
MSENTFGRKKATASDFSGATLVSSTTPTLANPVRGFGLPTNSELSTQQQAKFRTTTHPGKASRTRH